MKVAYFINQYPKVSHSFIRREIQALERQGLEIDRYALRTNVSELVDEEDQKEYQSTHYILDESITSFLFSFIRTLFTRPVKFFTTFALAIRSGWKSDRGLLRHIIYFIEACVLNANLKNNPVQHIHAHFGTNSATVVMLCHLLGGPKYSFTVHGPEEFDKPIFIGIAEKIRHADFVVAISSFGRSQLYRWVGHGLWNKIKIVHCGLEKSFYDGETLPVTQNGNFVCVGRLCEQKGQLLLVEAANKLKQEGRQFHLTLAGDGPMRADIEELIRSNELQKYISITGWISSEQVREKLLDSCLLILPSFAEGLPVVIMEAMALERPVITTYIAGIPELVNAMNGWLVPAGSLDDLVYAMRSALHTDSKTLVEMGKHAYEAVTQQHDIDKETARLASYFRSGSNLG